MPFAVEAAAGWNSFRRTFSRIRRARRRARGWVGWTAVTRWASKRRIYCLSSARRLPLSAFKRGPPSAPTCHATAPADGLASRPSQDAVDSEKLEPLVGLANALTRSVSGELEQVTSRIEAVQSGAETADEQQRAGMEKRVQVPNRPLAALSLSHK